MWNKKNLFLYPICTWLGWLLSDRHKAFCVPLYLHSSCTLVCHFHLRGVKFLLQKSWFWSRHLNNVMFCSFCHLILLYRTSSFLFLTVFNTLYIVYFTVFSLSNLYCPIPHFILYSMLYIYHMCIFITPLHLQPCPPVHCAAKLFFLSPPHFACSGYNREWHAGTVADYAKFLKAENSWSFFLRPAFKEFYTCQKC